MAASPRAAMPILEGILIMAGDDSIVLTGSDSMLTVSVKVKGDVFDAGAGVVRGKMFSDIVKKMPDGEIIVSSDKNARFTVSGGQAKFNIAGSDASQYPRRDSENIFNSVSVPNSVLYDMIEKTEQCVANDASRPVLTGGCLESINGQANMTALDGFRLSTRQCLCTPSAKDIEVIIPHKSLAMMKKLLNPSEETPITLSFTNTAMLVDIGGTELQSTLINGPYIKWRTLIPKDFSTRVAVNSDAFRDAIERAALIARGGENRLVKLSIGENTLSIMSRTSEDEVVEHIEVDQFGPDLDISFNVAYLSDMTRVIKTKRTMLNFTNSTSPCVVEPEGDKDCLWLILPVRTTA
ncbi:MAG: DNA polymerase III subunit beta [Alphaproteobacteria bacterium]|nr:DNA polymerase III subunit beta [Alphaproteobacteria bacterium]